MATTLATLNVLIGANLDGLKKGLANATKSLDRVGKDFQRVGATLTKSVTLPIVGIGVAATKMAVDFESSFAGIRKTMDLTEAEFQRLALANRQLAKEIPVAVGELNRIGELAGQLGIQGVNNVLKFEKTIAQLAVTTDLTADDAALSFAQIANVIQLPQDQIDRLGAAVVGLGNNFATVESAIVEFTSRIAGAGKLVDLTAGDITGIATAFSSLGVNAEAGGTAVQKVLLAMQTAVVQGGAELEAFAATAGLSGQAFQEAFRADAGQAFVQFVEGLGEQGDQAINTLTELGLSDQRLTRAFLAAAGAGDLLSRAVAQGNVEFEANTALTDEAAKRFATAQSQLTIFLNRLKDVGITLGNALIPALISAIDAMQPFIDVLGRIAEGFAGLDPTMQTVIIGIAGLAAAVGPLLAVLGVVLTTLPAIGAAFSILLGPVGLVAAAIVGLGVVWVKWGDDIKRITRSVVDFIVRAFDALTAVEDRVIQFGADVVRGLVQGMLNLGSFLVDKVTSFFSDNLIGPVKKLLRVESPSLVFAQIGTDVVAGLALGMDTAVPVLARSAQRIGSTVVTTVNETTSGAFDQLESFGKQTFGTLTDAVADFATGSENAFDNFVKSAIQGLTRLIVKMLAVKAIGALIPGGGLLGGLIPGLAAGGAVMARRPVLVGEQGPELFVPRSAGEIIANDQLTAGGNITLSIDTSGLPPAPRAVSPDALAVDDWYRRLFSGLVADFKERAGANAFV